MTKSPRKSSKPLLATSEMPLRSQARKARDPDQPRLPLDPMPERIEPALALLKPEVPRGPQWLYEIKWDGYRLAVHVEPGRARILTRGGRDWTDRFPTIANEAAEFGTTMILDGEAVVLDEKGKSSFGALQRALGGRGGRRRASEAIFYAFDLLYFDGHDLAKLDLAERRQILDGLLLDHAGVIKLSEAVEADGDELLAAACAHGLEGIIAKNRDQPYRSGRTGDWVKVKCVQSDSFFIVGYEPSAVAHGGIRNLFLAAYRGDDLVYVGNVGTGFNERDATRLRKDLDKLKTSRAPIALKQRGVVWVQPTLIAEIEYRAWTDDGKLRHASYKGLRERQDNAEVYRLPQ